MDSFVLVLILVGTNFVLLEISKSLRKIAKSLKKDKDIKVDKALLCSTAYITESDSEKLLLEDYDTSSAPLIAAYTYGFIFYVPDMDDILEEHFDDMKRAGYSQAFMDLIQYASKNEYSIIRMDGEITAPDIQGLSLQKW